MSGWQEPRPGLGVWGGVPLSGAWPPGWGTTQPLLLYAEGVGEKAPETAGERLDPLGGLGGPCPAGREGDKGRLKTTRINRFVYHEQARIFTS